MAYGRRLLLSDAIECGAAHSKAARQFLAIGARCVELGFERGDLVRRQLRLGAEPHSRRLGARDALGCALLDQVALELADGREHVEQQAPRGAAGIDGLVEDDEVDLLGGDLGCDLREIEDGACEAIEPCDDELVPFADEAQGVCQRRAFLAAGAAPLLLEYPIAASGTELRELRLQILPDRRDAGVSDLHVSWMY